MQWPFDRSGVECLRLATHRGLVEIGKRLDIGVALFDARDHRLGDSSNGQGSGVDPRQKFGCSQLIGQAHGRSLRRTCRQ